MKDHPYAKQIWDRLMSGIGNEYGVAGLMGNLQAESGLYPDRVQGDIPYSNFSKSYTARVDQGIIGRNEFIHNGPNGGGYGLAQWTYYTRKENLYNKWVNGNYSSIGSVELACDYLLEELNRDYDDVMFILKNAVSIQVGAEYVLTQFEKPAEQSTAVKQERTRLATEIYNTFSGSAPENPDTPSFKIKRLSKLLLLAVASDDF